MVKATVLPSGDASQVAALLDSPEIARLIGDLDAARWTGRPGYPMRAMVGLALVRSVYALPTWTRAVRLVAEHDALRRALGGEAPSVHAAYRFAAKLREHGDLLTACLDRVLAELRAELPGMGETVCIDGSDMPAWANGQRRVSRNGPLRERFSDPDASWGHRSSVSTRSGGGYYGYKIHAAVCATTGLPVAWQVETAKVSETVIVAPLLDKLAQQGIVPAHCVMDRGYDTTALYDECERRGIRPVIPLRMTPAVRARKHRPPTCDHGVWTFAGADAKRQASKWRCPTGECSPASVWVKADRLHPLIPRGTDRYRSLYRSRGAVERCFGHLKTEWGFLPLRVRRLVRVRLHTDLTMLARLGSALLAARANALPLVA
ncbi:MAG: transposase [Frankiaceae bacterium]